MSDFFYFYLFLNCIMILLHNNSNVESHELQHVQILYRHGDRAPIRLYPRDPNPKSSWIEGLGQLTQLGKKQQYNFGKMLRQTYSSFITSSPLEVKITSAECNRCFESAQCNAASFFAPNVNWTIASGFPWQPIFIQYVPEAVDNLFEFAKCPKADEEHEKVMNSLEVDRINRENEPLYQYVSNYSGLNITNFTEAAYLYDTLFIEKKHNLTVPTWADKYWNQLHNISSHSFYWSFNSPLLLKLRAGPLLGSILENMEKKASGLIPQQRVYIYSGHDLNVALMMQTLGVYNMLSPPYCSALVFELYKSEDDYTVRLLFYNSSNPEDGSQTPHALVMPGCSEYCPLNYVLNYSMIYIPKNWHKECQSSSFSSFEFPEIGLVAASCITAVTLISIVAIYYIVYKLWCERKEGREYAYHLMASS